MQQLEDVIVSAVENKAVPFAIASVASSDSVLWTGATGNSKGDDPASADTILRIFSMTKAIGSLAATMLVDQGKLRFDDEVQSVLPQFGDLKLLEGFDGDEPVLRHPTRRATLGHLLTHTSGLEYEFWNGDAARCVEAAGIPSILSGQAQGLNYPLVFEPGEKWGYGIGIDWAGQVVEAVDGRSIDVFCREEIFEPLGMSSTFFDLDDDTEQRLADVFIRSEAGGFDNFELGPPQHPEVYGMGHAAYGTASDFIVFLQMLLNGGIGNGTRFLSPEMCERFLGNQIGDLTVEPRNSMVPALSADLSIFPDTRKSHSYCAMRFEEDVPGMRSAGTNTWAGLANTHFWIDPKKDVAAVLMTQTVPFIEPQFLSFYEEFERTVYQHIG